MSKAPKGKVRCDSCRRLYKAIFEEYEQGMDCAATYNEDRGLIHGHYGSREADTEVLQLTRKPKWLKPGTVCDNCIKTLRKNDLVKEVGRCL